MKGFLQFILLILMSFSCHKAGEKKPAWSNSNKNTELPQTISLLGDTLYAAKPGNNILAKYKLYKEKYEAQPDSIDNIIWFGRFAAYKGDYREAIEIYTKGIKKYPGASRLYRHRGHRYISTRQFDLAIADLEKASQFITDTENEMEPDGLPNAQNIPVSSKHGNIWYHLGLAYYLQHDYENALEAYKNCLSSTQNNDNIVSATHWIYMILRRLDQSQEAEQYLEAITPEMEVIENMAYHKACLFYKEEISLQELSESIEEGSGGDAMKYALGSWFFYNGEKEKAQQVYLNMMENSAWNSFGYIAAESDLAKYFH